MPELSNMDFTHFSKHYFLFFWCLFWGVFCVVTLHELNLYRILDRCCFFVVCFLANLRCITVWDVFPSCVKVTVIDSKNQVKHSCLNLDVVRRPLCEVMSHTTENNNNK